MRSLLGMLGLGERNHDPDAVSAEAAARRAFELKHPELEATNSMVRASEDDRMVIAVLYRDREQKRVQAGRPTYKLFAVRRNDLSAEELTPAADSPYHLRGVK